MTRDAIKKNLSTASSASAVARCMDVSIAVLGWEETDRLIREIAVTRHKFA